MSKIKIFLLGFKSGFKDFGLFISDLINTILLALAYLIGIGATFLIAKIFSKHFLELKKPENSLTYWSELDLSKESKENYYRQF